MQTPLKVAKWNIRFILGHSYSAIFEIKKHTVNLNIQQCQLKQLYINNNVYICFHIYFVLNLRNQPASSGNGTNGNCTVHSTVQVYIYTVHQWYLYCTVLYCTLMVPAMYCTCQVYIYNVHQWYQHGTVPFRYTSILFINGSCTLLFRYTYILYTNVTWTVPFRYTFILYTNGTCTVPFRYTSILYINGTCTVLYRSGIHLYCTSMVPALYCTVQVYIYTVHQ